MKQNLAALPIAEPAAQSFGMQIESKHQTKRGGTAVVPRVGASLIIVCAGLGTLLESFNAKAQPNYLVPLPQDGIVIGLNNSGQVLYDGGLLTGNVYTPFPAGFTTGPEGNGNSPPPPSILSDSGVVAGNTAAGHLAIYSGGTVTDLGLPSWSQNATPTAINASGQIVGVTSDFTAYGFLYSGGVFNPIHSAQLTDIPPPPLPTAINDSGQLALSGFSSNSPCRGFFITGAALTDLGSVCPSAINASGQVIGTWFPSDSITHASIWANGTLTVLAEPAPYTYSYGDAINKDGQIVGRMGNAQSQVPFFYNGVMTDINSLVSASDPLKSSVTISSVITLNDSRLLLVLSTVPVVGSPTAYLLQAPWLDVAPGPLTFANQAIGTTSQPQMLTLTNSGTAPLPLDSISLAAGTADFSQTNECPQSLAAGANCAVSVTFTPSAVEIKNAVLNVVTDGATIAVPLSGMTPIIITLSADPTSPSVGHPFTITWAATPASSCQSSGGTAGDGWTATTASGSVSVTEGAAGTYTYTMTCGAGGMSTAQSLKVEVANLPALPAPPASGGGGALDLTSLLLLVGLLALNWRTKPSIPLRRSILRH